MMRRYAAFSVSRHSLRAILPDIRLLAVGILVLLLIGTTSALAQSQSGSSPRVIDLTFDSAVEIALSNSYRVVRQCHESTD